MTWRWKYDRPIAVGGFEVGCAEKALSVTNCNHLWVRAS